MARVYCPVVCASAFTASVTVIIRVVGAAGDEIGPVSAERKRRSVNQSLLVPGGAD